MTNKLGKIAKWALYLLSLALIINTLSHTFDGDLGWHLRFGQEIINGSFPYSDTYTWSFWGHNYTNHEWGGDILFWSLYSHWGYYSLVLLTGLAIWLSLILITKTFTKEKSLIAPMVVILIAILANFIITARLAMLSTLFFALIIFTLEKLDKKTYWYWPIIFWFWAALHGSWILGFIVITIYLTSYLITQIIPTKYEILIGKKMIWDKKLWWKVLAATVASAVAVMANPYGKKIWTEIIHYFSENYFKSYINEWLPSYAFPVFPWPLIIAAVCLAFVIWGLIKKKITLAQFLLYLAIFYATLQHKRNNLYLLILLAPIITIILTKITEMIRIKKQRIFFNVLYALIIISSITLAFFQIKNTNYSRDPFNNPKLLSRWGAPYEAVTFLKQNNQQENSKIFNEFWWGGYLNWTMRESLVYLDGRGTATWRLNNQETLLGAYRRLKFENNGLEELEKNQVKYVILERNFSGYSQSDKFNKFLFGDKINQVLEVKDPQLVTDLEQSENWELIYKDNIALIWKNLTVR